MKKHIILILFFISPMAFAEYTADYETNNYIIHIKVNCDEGNVDCNNVSYTGVSKKDKKSIHLSGKTMNNPSAHDFQGYEFHNGKTAYYIYADENKLAIMKGDKTLLSEDLKPIDTSGS